jgi:hypothetical protein
VQTQPVGERSIVGFSGANRAELLAVGWDELVLRLENGKWVEEHFAVGPPKGKRGRNADDLLQSVVTLPGKPQPTAAAVGPWLVLVRHPDRTWHPLTESERRAASLLAHEGPPELRPTGCALASWNWVAGERAVFSCHDGRGFVFDAGKTLPTGKLPRACRQAVDHAHLRNTDAFTLCDGKLWRSDGTRWQLVDGPRKIRDYAVTDRCFYAVTERAVWRRCAP